MKNTEKESKTLVKPNVIWIMDILQIIYSKSRNYDNE